MDNSEKGLIRDNEFFNEIITLEEDRKNYLLSLPINSDNILCYFHLEPERIAEMMDDEEKYSSFGTPEEIGFTAIIDKEKKMYYSYKEEGFKMFRDIGKKMEEEDKKNK